MINPVLCRAEYKLLEVVRGRGLIRGGRSDFEVHPGDQMIVPSSTDYAIINNGSETLHLEPIDNKMNDKTNSKNQYK